MTMESTIFNEADEFVHEELLHSYDQIPPRLYASSSAAKKLNFSSCSDRHDSCVSNPDTISSEKNSNFNGPTERNPTPNPSAEVHCIGSSTLSPPYTKCKAVHQSLIPEVSLINNNMNSNISRNLKNGQEYMDHSGFLSHASMVNLTGSQHEQEYISSSGETKRFDTAYPAFRGRSNLQGQYYVDESSVANLQLNSAMVKLGLQIHEEEKEENNSHRYNAIFSSDNQQIKLNSASAMIASGGNSFSAKNNNLLHGSLCSLPDTSRTKAYFAGVVPESFSSSSSAPRMRDSPCLNISSSSRTIPTKIFLPAHDQMQMMTKPEVTCGSERNIIVRNHFDLTRFEMSSIADIRTLSRQQCFEKGFPCQYSDGEYAQSAYLLHHHHESGHLTPPPLMKTSKCLLIPDQRVLPENRSLINGVLDGRNNQYINMEPMANSINQQKITQFYRQLAVQKERLMHMQSEKNFNGNIQQYNQVELPSWVSRTVYSPGMGTHELIRDFQDNASFPDMNHSRLYIQGTCHYSHHRHESSLASRKGFFNGELEKINQFPNLRNQNRETNYGRINGEFASTISATDRKITENNLKLEPGVSNGRLFHSTTDDTNRMSNLAMPDSKSSNGVDSMQEILKLMSLDDIEGRIYNIARDQHGCQLLQRKLDEAKFEDVEKVLKEIKDHVVELMTDPFGNYLVQKLLDICNEAQYTAILEAVTKNNNLVDISLNMHGTRAAQKLVEKVQTPKQIIMLISSLKHGVVTLIKDLNGNHLVQRCLQCLSNEDHQFIIDAAASHCVEIASHRHGCCVLQRCVDFASGFQRQILVSEIAINSLELSQDSFGNYVVQYILELELPWASAEVIARLEGNYAHLAMHKFGSNVIEKCLYVATEENKVCIIKELIGSTVLNQLLQDPYANYVVQSALQVTKSSVSFQSFTRLPFVFKIDTPRGIRVNLGNLAKFRLLSRWVIFTRVWSMLSNHMYECSIAARMVKEFYHGPSSRGERSSSFSVL